MLIKITTDTKKLMEEQVYGIIYHLRFPNGGYIGQTIQNKNKRWKEHLRDTKAGSKLPVHNAIRKYSNKDLTITKVQMCVIDKAYSFEELNNLEVKYINEYNTFNDNGNNPNGYNMTIGGEGCKSYKFTEEQKETLVDKLLYMIDLHGFDVAVSTVGSVKNLVKVIGKDNFETVLIEHKFDPNEIQLVTSIYDVSDSFYMFGGVVRQKLMRYLNDFGPMNKKQ